MLVHYAPANLSSRAAASAAANSLFAGKRKKGRRQALPSIAVPVPLKKSEASQAPNTSVSGWGLFKTLLFGYLMLFSGVQQARAQLQQNDPRFSHNTPNASPPRFTDWNSNVDVLASCSQRHFSIYDRLSASGFYTQALLETLRLPETESLGQAHSLLQETGYSTTSSERIQKPVSTYSVQAERDCLPIWSKHAGPNVVRFALLLVNGKEVRANLNLMRTMLKDVYHLPPENILQVKDGKNDDFRRGLRRLMQKATIAKHAGHEVETLVYYSGHGRAIPWGSANLLTCHEGEADGVIQTADGLMSKDKFRGLIGGYLPDINTMLILDSCHSGSWVG